MIRSDHLTNVLLGMIVVLLAFVVLRPTVLRLTERPELPEPRFGERTFSQWQGYLGDLSPGVRRTAVEALGYFGPQAVPVLVQTLKNDSHAEVRMSVASALGGLGPAAKEALPVLIEASRASESRVRASAAVALGKIGPDAKETVPALTQLLEDVEPGVRLTAVQALADLGPVAKEAVPHLIQALRDTNARMQQAAIRALGNIGPAAKDAIPQLRKLADDDQLKALRPSVLEALGKIQGS